MKYEQSKLYIKKSICSRSIYMIISQKYVTLIHPKSRNKNSSQSSQLHPHLGLLNSNFGIGTELVDGQVPADANLNLHQLQFPHLYLHGNIGLQIQGNAGRLLLPCERRNHVAGELSAGPSERHVQESGVLMALVEHRQGARAELRAQIRNGEMAVVEVVYADLLVGIPGLYIHSELAICAVVGVDGEISDLDALDRVLGDLGPEDQVQNATGDGDDHDERY